MTTTPVIRKAWKNRRSGCAKPYENMRDAIGCPGRCCISGTRYMLVELSDFSIPPFVGEALLRFAQEGITPIITHPERNRIMSGRPERVMDLIEKGCLVQVTGSALLGRFGETPQRCARWLLAHGAAHALASDARDAVMRPPLLSAARQAAARFCGEEAADALVEHNPRAIVAGVPLPFHPSAA